MEAIKNLIGAGAIFCKRDSKGNLYKINLDMSIDEVVKKVNQLRKFTRSRKASLPHQVKLLALQKKGKQRERKDEFLIKPNEPIKTGSFLRIGEVRPAEPKEGTPEWVRLKCQ